MTSASGGSLQPVDYAFWLAYGWPWYVAAFLIGSIPFGLIVGRLFFKTDIRAAGSGNIGAANALRTMGRRAGIAVLVLDALKGVVATALPFLTHAPQTALAVRRADVGAATRLPDHGVTLYALCALCALAAIAGHCYSPWLRLKGGKGVATLLGVFIVAAWPSALAFCAVWLAIVLPTGYASLGSIAATFVGAVAIAIVWGPASFAVSLPAALLIVWKHRENISRLAAGTESKLNLLKH